jgi:hypothetical protein
VQLDCCRPAALCSLLLPCPDLCGGVICCRWASGTPWLPACMRTSRNTSTGGLATAANVWPPPHHLPKIISMLLTCRAAAVATLC